MQSQYSTHVVHGDVALAWVSQENPQHDHWEELTWGIKWEGFTLRGGGEAPVQPAQSLALALLRNSTPVP